MKKQILLVLLLLFALMACEQVPPEDHSDEVDILVENQLDLRIDSFQFHFDTSYGEDSILVTMLEPGEKSESWYFEDLKYFYREQSDFFLIKKGYFIIDSRIYYHSNCFCEPDLQDDILTEGKVVIKVNGIDSIRGNVEYNIIKE